MKKLALIALLFTACAEVTPGLVVPADKPQHPRLKALGTQEDISKQAQAFCGIESWHTEYTTFDKTEAFITCSDK